MANSRSNIYPVQLQGAELNLNKLDAEIKQYSGFNKNNAPFVGGCLSNIFVRTQNVEGATDDNTIIDEEGNIYTVDTEGFYKNGEKVIAYENTPFITVEKFAADANVVKAYSDKVLLRKINGKYFLNDVELGYSKLNDEEFTSYAAGIWYEGKFILACTCYNTLNSSSTIRVVTLEKNEEGKYVLGNVNYTYGISFFNSAYSIFISNNQFLIIYKYAEDTDGVFYADIFVGNFESSSVNRYENYYNEKFAEFAEGWSDSYNDKTQCLSKYNQTCRVDFYSYPRNMVVYKYMTDGIPINATKPTALAIKVNPDTDLNMSNTQDIRLIFRPENVVVASQTGSSDPGRFPNDSSYYDTRNRNFITCNEKDNSLLRNTVGYFNLTRPIANTKLFYNPLGGINLSLGDDELFHDAAGATITLENCIFAVLLNNGYISGIAAYNDYNKILVSEWNSVKSGSISYLQETENGKFSLVYGDYNGNYYILRETDKPCIKRFYNQIVSNVLFNENSYDIKRNRVLYFAPGFNCSSAHKEIKDHFKRATVTSNSYRSSAINEYSQENNSSIILNPVPVAVLSIEPLRNCYVNYYTGSVTVTYNTSYYLLNDGEVITYKNSDLEGLPFPIDANGNVEYSPNLFSEMSQYGTDVFIKSGNTAYPLVIGNNNEPIMSFYMASGIENLKEVFIIQGQYYGTIGNQLFAMQFSGGVVQNVSFIVDITGLEFVGNTPYEALFFSKTNRCLFSFTGANVLTQKQFIDKISEVKDYLYNPATQTVFLITDIGVLFYGLFGQFLLEYPDISKIFLLQNGIVMSDNAGDYRYIKYYLDESDTDFVKENIRLETCFYGMNNQTVTINDCLYMRIFSEEHEEGDLEVSATTLSLKGRMTEKTTFRIKERDWDKLTHTIYLRYQPKEQRGLGISFSINSPFKIASLSIGSQADAILIDKVSKGAINAPQITSNNVEW